MAIKLNSQEKQILSRIERVVFAVDKNHRVELRESVPMKVARVIAQKYQTLGRGGVAVEYSYKGCGLVYVRNTKR